MTNEPAKPQSECGCCRLCRKAVKTASYREEQPETQQEGHRHASMLLPVPYMRYRCPAAQVMNMGARWLMAVWSSAALPLLLLLPPQSLLMPDIAARALAAAHSRVPISRTDAHS